MSAPEGGGGYRDHQEKFLGLVKEMKPGIDVERAVGLLRKMREQGVRPSQQTYSALVQVCAQVEHPPPCLQKEPLIPAQMRP